MSQIYLLMQFTRPLIIRNCILTKSIEANRSSLILMKHFIFSCGCVIVCSLKLKTMFIKKKMFTKNVHGRVLFGFITGAILWLL